MLKLLKAIVTAFSVAMFSAAVIFVALLMTEVWRDTKSVTKTVSAPFTWTQDTIRVLRGKHEHTPASKSDSGQLTLEDRMFAAMLGMDSDGELEVHRIAVMRELADAVLRLIEQNESLTIPIIFRKAYLWVPLDWDHQKNATFWWVDRDLERTEGNIPPDILRQAELIVREKKGARADPQKCAVHIVRAKNHDTTRWSGERKARARIMQMTPDPVLSALPYRTKFFCNRYRKVSLPPRSNPGRFSIYVIG